MHNHILEMKSVKKTFYIDKKPKIQICISELSMHAGTCLGIVGESGSGKSTTARMITGLLKPDEGQILLGGEDIFKWKGKQKRDRAKKVQMVFQFPQESFDPRRTLGDGVMESLLNFGMKKKEAEKRRDELFTMVELNPSFAHKYPHQVSGGQCQRAAIARALAIEPELIICDEATSALDVTVQRQIIDLLKDLQKRKKLSLIMICHDLAVVQEICDEVAVMYEGSIVESGTVEAVLSQPKTDYTKMLIEAVL